MATKEEVEEVLDNHYEDYFLSREEPHNPLTFGDTTTGKYLAVVFEIVEADPATVYPITTAPIASARYITQVASFPIIWNETPMTVGSPEMFPR